MNYIGIDIGKEKCVVCVIGEDDDKKETMSYENTYASALECAKSLKAKYGECKAVCEATGSLWIKDVDAFEDADVPIVLANPLKNTYVCLGRVWLGYLVFCYPPMVSRRFRI